MRRRYRWGVVIVLPPNDVVDFTVRSALVRCRRRKEARRRLPEIERWPSVDRAALDEGAYLEVRRLNRDGFVI